jgi:hypothetical protein
MKHFFYNNCHGCVRSGECQIEANLESIDQDWRFIELLSASFGLERDEDIDHDTLRLLIHRGFFRCYLFQPVPQDDFQAYIDANVADIGEASHITGYEKSYLTRLAKSGKIVGTQTKGGFWLFHIPSLYQK